jgi:hypothetical protein
MAVEAVNGRKTVTLPRSRDGKPSPSLRNAFTVWHAEPTRENVSKKWAMVSRICMSGSRATLPA